MDGGAEGPTRPFLRWPGGKTYLLPQIAQLLSGFPCRDHNYLEPMIGGGAVYWAFAHRFRQCTISDLNPDLVNLYRVIQNDGERLSAELRNGEYWYRGKRDAASRANFRRVLDSDPADPILRAARYLYINKTCWGGMMRVNGAGKLAASPNPRGNPAICDAQRLRACSAALRDTHIRCGPAHHVIAEELVSHPDRQVLLFVDPPYHDPDPRRFVDYSGDFTHRDQATLVHAVLGSRCRFIYTNKATDFIVSLFAGARGVERITLPLRHKIGARGRVEEELLAHNLT